jgi:hypothetical protein
VPRLAFICARSIPRRACAPRMPVYLTIGAAVIIDNLLLSASSAGRGACDESSRSW